MFFEELLNVFLRRNLWMSCLLFSFGPIFGTAGFEVIRRSAAFVKYFPEWEIGVHVRGGDLQKVSKEN